LGIESCQGVKWKGFQQPVKAARHFASTKDHNCRPSRPSAGLERSSFPAQRAMTSVVTALPMKFVGLQNSDINRLTPTISVINAIGTDRTIAKVAAIQIEAVTGRHDHANNARAASLPHPVSTLGWAARFPMTRYRAPATSSGVG